MFNNPTIYSVLGASLLESIQCKKLKGFDQCSSVFFFSPPAAFVLSLTPDVTILGRPQIVRMFSVTHYSSGSFTGQTEVSKAIRWERNGFDKVLRLAVVAIWTAGAVRLTVLEEPRRM